jgi:hypothetical protein
VDALALEPLGRADPLPGAGDLDQHPLARHPGLLVQADQAPRLGDRAFAVERQAGVDLGRDPPLDVAEDLAPEIDEQPLHGGLRAALAARDRVLDQAAIALVAGRGEQKGGVGGRVARLPARHGVDVARVGDHDRVLPERFELIDHGAAYPPGAGVQNPDASG